MRTNTYAGLGPQSLQGAGSGSGENPAYPLEVYQTPVLDLTKTYSDVELLPARPGYFPVILTSVWVIISRSGTQTTPPTFQAGNNTAHTNLIASVSTLPSNADVNGANPPSQTSTVGAVVNLTQRIVNATSYFDITAAASGTGGYSCMAQLVVEVVWMASGS